MTIGRFFHARRSEMIWMHGKPRTSRTSPAPFRTGLIALNKRLISGRCSSMNELTIASRRQICVLSLCTISTDGSVGQCLTISVAERLFKTLKSIGMMIMMQRLMGSWRGITLPGNCISLLLYHPSTWQLRSELLHGRTIGTEPIRMASRGVKVSRCLEELVLSVESGILVLEIRAATLVSSIG